MVINHVIDFEARFVGNVLIDDYITVLELQQSRLRDFHVMSFEARFVGKLFLVKMK